MNIDLLNWHLPEAEQRANMAAVHIASAEDIEALILPAKRKDCWENCAILLASLDNSRLLPFLPRLMEWYQDMNWPGFELIDRRVKQLPYNTLRVAVADALRKATSEHDSEWHENLQSAFDDLENGDNEVSM